MEKPILKFIYMFQKKYKVIKKIYIYIALTIAAEELNQGLPKSNSAESDLISERSDLGSAAPTTWPACCIIRSSHVINESIDNSSVRTSPCLPISFHLMSIH